jgi:hypothetical protein
MDVISIHVLKTAGSTFWKYLTSVYGAERVVLDYDDYVLSPLSLYNTDREAWRASAVAKARAIGPEFRAIQGHFSAQKYMHVFPEARVVTWVRHPVSWVISLYYYWRHWPKYHGYDLPFLNPLVRRVGEEQLSLVEFAEDPTVRNPVSRIFLEGTALESLAFVGIQEHFEDDLQTLVRMMGWPEIPVNSINKSPEPSYADRLREHHADRRLIDRLVSLNEADMALYEEALRLRAERLQERQIRSAWDARKAAVRGIVQTHREDRVARPA